MFTMFPVNGSGHECPPQMIERLRAGWPTLLLSVLSKAYLYEAAPTLRFS